MVSILHRCSYDNSAISPVNKLKNNMALLSFFPSFTCLSFTFLFNLFCFSSLCQRVVLLNFLNIKVNPNSLLFSQRESRRSPVVRGGWAVRWCWVNFQCRGVPLIWIIVRQRPIALAVGAGWGCLDIFSVVYLFSFLSPSLGDGWADID